MGLKNILIIDDAADFCITVKSFLEISPQSDFRVHMAKNGKEGIRAAKKLRPDLILLDVMMPGMDGFEVLKRLKEDPDTMSISVAMLTAKGDEESKLRAMRLYNDDYISKTIELPALQEKINEILARRGFK